MAQILDLAKLEEAFAGDPTIVSAIKAAAVSPPYIELFNKISVYTCSLQNGASPGPASKKRRLGEDLSSRPAQNGTNGIKQEGGMKEGSASLPVADEAVLLEVKEISVSIPQRKKYTLCFTPTYFYACLPNSTEPVAGITLAWKDIDHIFYLPVPEKTQVQHNYVIFTKSSSNASAAESSIVFTVPNTAPREEIISGQDAAAASAVSDDYKTLLHWAFTNRLKAVGNPKKIVEADDRVFSSAIRQAHRPKEKAVFVKAFRGSKDGYLFFLPGGILWGFKKPMMFLAKEHIESLSFTSVLQRTFNLSIEMDPVGDAASEEIEFMMIDIEDYAGIDEYVKRHGLADKSMAEQRKAKKENINVEKDADGNVVGSAEAGELEKAQLEAGEMQLDDEDEDEEDYDPGSEGESEGEGTSESEDDEADGGGGGEEGEEGEDDEDEEEEDES